MQAADEGKLTLLCPSCKRGVVPAISNRLHLIMRQKIAEYYNNNFKCRCNKQYSLSPVTDCCKVKHKPRSNIPFDLHELVYIGKELVLSTSRELGEEAARKLRGIETKLD